MRKSHRLFEFTNKTMRCSLTHAARMPRHGVRLALTPRVGHGRFGIQKLLHAPESPPMLRSVRRPPRLAKPSTMPAGCPTLRRGFFLVMVFSYGCDFVVGDLPDAVRTAQTDTTGLVDLTCVYFVPIKRKSAPAALTMEALCMTYSCGTSL